MVQQVRVIKSQKFQTEKSGFPEKQDDTADLRSVTDAWRN